MLNNQNDVSQAKSDNRNYTRVNNHFNFTINFGDSLNMLGLLAGIFFIKTITNKKKANKRKKALILP